MMQSSGVTTLFANRRYRPYVGAASDACNMRLMDKTFYVSPMGSVMVDHRSPVACDNDDDDNAPDTDWRPLVVWACSRCRARQNTQPALTAASCGECGAVGLCAGCVSRNRAPGGGTDAAQCNDCYVRRMLHIP